MDSLSFPIYARGSLPDVCVCEIRADAIRVRGVVVVAIAVVVDIREIRRRNNPLYRGCPLCLFIFQMLQEAVV